MNPARYPSKERVERDSVLVYAEGDDLINDVDEMARQGYDVDDIEEAVPQYATERIERDGVLVYAEGDQLRPEDQAPAKGRKAGKGKAVSAADEPPSDVPPPAGDDPAGDVPPAA